MPPKIARPDEITHMQPSMLVSATYDPASKSACLKFYDPREKRIVLWYDNTGHRPYCYAMMSPRRDKVCDRWRRH